MASPAKEIATMPGKINTVIEDVTSQVRAGALRPGDKLPSAREMREQYDVSQMTIRMAIERLRAEGWVVTVPGSGVYVAPAPPVD